MPELVTTIPTFVLTVLAGVFIFALTKVLSDFVLEPIKEQRGIIGEIADALGYYANLYCNPATSTINEPLDSPSHLGSNKIRQLSTLLLSRTYMIPGYAFLEKRKLVIPLADVESAAGMLIYLSNSFYVHGEWDRSPGTVNSDTADKVRHLLRIKRLPLVQSA